MTKNMDATEQDKKDIILGYIDMVFEVDKMTRLVAKAKRNDKDFYIQLVDDYPNIYEYCIKDKEYNIKLNSDYDILNGLIESEKKSSNALQLDDIKLSEYIKAMHSKLSEIELTIRSKINIRNKYLFDNFDPRNKARG